MSQFDIRSLRILLSFLALTGLPLAGFAGLGWRFLQQDRDLELQRQREQLQNASELLVRELRTQLDVAEDAVSAPDGAPTPTNSSAFLRIQAGQLVERSGAALPFYPIAMSGEGPASRFDSAERYEFDGHCDVALATYAEFARSAHEELRAAALVRVARCLRKLNRDMDALDTYAQLAALGGRLVAGMPAELLARRERVDLLTKANNVDAARAEQQALRAALSNGAFAIDRGTFEFLSETLGHGGPSIPEMPMALAADTWASRWRADECGRLAETFAGGAVLGLGCRDSTDGVRVMLLPADDVFGGLVRAAESMHVAVGVSDIRGRAIWGAVQGEPVTVARQMSDLGLPWQLHVRFANPMQVTTMLARRRALAAGGLTLMIAIVASAGFFVFRAFNRELEIARLQSDFISTVSHEFRTPLTAMNHLIEMLVEAAVPAERVPQYYDALHRETSRLHRVVEGLLDFRRFEAGRHAYRMQPMDVRDAVRQVVEGYATRDVSSRLRVSLDAASAMICGDRDAVAVAVSNLVDNAFKYSPADAPVAIQVAPRGKMVGITVADRGPGLSRNEQRRVFRKFVRGAAAQETNVKGTGIGLAIVQAVVKAHGGRVDLESAPGRGSTFTLLLPRV